MIKIFQAPLAPGHSGKHRGRRKRHRGSRNHDDHDGLRARQHELALVSRNPAAAVPRGDAPPEPVPQGGHDGGGSASHARGGSALRARLLQYLIREVNLDADRFVPRVKLTFRVLGNLLYFCIKTN